jgi:hypothetical protein
MGVGFTYPIALTPSRIGGAKPNFVNGIGEGWQDAGEMSNPEKPAVLMLGWRAVAGVFGVPA